MKKYILLLIVVIVGCLCSPCSYGQGKISRQKPEVKKHIKTTGIIDGHEWVDLGLPSGLKWATCNVGTYNPSDYGGHYAWGEIRCKSEYNWDNCFDCLDKAGDCWNIYKIGGEEYISPKSGHDAAREIWGDAWRMPTEKELEELVTKCKWVWTSKGGHKGYEITGPNGNSLFLPAAGCRGPKGLDGNESFGYYWSSTMIPSKSSDSYSKYFGNGSGACCLSFSDGSLSTNVSSGQRRFGRSIRPVVK